MWFVARWCYLASQILVLLRSGRSLLADVITLIKDQVASIWGKFHFKSTQYQSLKCVYIFEITITSSKCQWVKLSLSSLDQDHPSHSVANLECSWCRAISWLSLGINKPKHIVHQLWVVHRSMSLLLCVIDLCFLHFCFLLLSHLFFHNFLLYTSQTLLEISTTTKN